MRSINESNCVAETLQRMAASAMAQATRPVQHTAMMAELAAARKCIEQANHHLARALEDAQHLSPGVSAEIVQQGKPLGRVHGDVLAIMVKADKEVQS